MLFVKWLPFAHLFGGASMHHELIQTLKEFLVHKPLHQLVALLKIVEHLERMLVREAVGQCIHHATLKWQGVAPPTQETSREAASEMERR